MQLLYQSSIGFSIYFYLFNVIFIVIAFILLGMRGLIRQLYIEYIHGCVCVLYISIYFTIPFLSLLMWIRNVYCVQVSSACT